MQAEGGEHPPVESSSSAASASRVAPIANENVFLLPGGYVDESGVAHREVELREITGEIESLFGSFGPEAHTASLVTSLLARTVKRIGSIHDPGVTLARDLLVGDRDYLILKLRELTLGTKVNCVLRCPDGECGELMDLNFDTSVFEFSSAPIARRIFSTRTLDGLDVDFRLPTGGDQEALAALFASDPIGAADELMARCLRRVGASVAIDRAVVAGLSERTRAELEKKMARVAPRVELELESQCPECRKSFETPFDFTTFFFDELRGKMRSLEHEVHFLAWHYHWSEKDILSMTRKKRKRYVALLQQEVDRLNQVW
jgi:hypothetical protein